MLYYDVDDKPEINDINHALVERIGSGCIAEDIPYFVEILTYDASDMDVTSREYASLKSVQCVNSANHSIMQTFLR